MPRSRRDTFGNPVPAVDKRSVNLLTIAITLALIGLTAIQAEWIASTLELKREQFRESVNNALVAVSDRLERAEVAGGIRRQEGRYIVLGPGEGAPKGLSPMDSTGGSPVDTPPEPMIGADAEDAGQREAMISEMVRGILESGGSRGMRERLDPLLLDSLLVEELHAHGVSVPAEHAVLDAQGTVVLMHAGPSTTPEMLKASDHRVRLFRNDMRGEPHWLHVWIPGQQKLVWGSMRLLLVVSAVFTLIIALAFIHTLRTIRRQKRLNDIRTDLVNNLTHELKTPISTIALACEAITDPSMPKTPEQVSGFVGMIRDENKRLGMLVESVLQSAVLDSGAMRIKPVDLDIHAVLRDVERHSAIQVQRRDGRIVLDLKAELAHVTGDRIHLTNVFYNLVDNAIKYSREAPEVRISTRSDTDGITVSVADNGVGIAPAEQKKIFDRLYRVPTGNVHNVKGFGLGLSYVKAVVERHGGRIRVESEPGRGSTFHAFLPFEHGNTSHQTAAGRG